MRGYIQIGIFGWLNIRRGLFIFRIAQCQHGVVLCGGDNGHSIDFGSSRRTTGNTVVLHFSVERYPQFFYLNGCDMEQNLIASGLCQIERCFADPGNTASAVGSVLGKGVILARLEVFKCAFIFIYRVEISVTQNAAGFALLTLRSLRADGTLLALRTLRTLRTDGALLALFALFALRTLGTLRADGTLFALLTLRSLRADRALLALFALLTLGTLRADGTLFALLTLFALGTLRTLRTLRADRALLALFTLFALGTLRADGALLALFALRTLRTYGALLALLTLRTLRADGALFALLTLRTLRAERSLRSSWTYRTNWSPGASGTGRSWRPRNHRARRPRMTA